ncbi:hypothetical protein ACJJTC_000367 [Scirpophaga incertulas]
MKSKSFDYEKKRLDNIKQNRTFEFTKYYKTEAETSESLENINKTDNVNKENRFTSNKNVETVRERSPNKKKSKLAPLDVSQIDFDGPILDTSEAKNSPHNESKITSTPQTGHKSNKNSKMKSIMKSSSGNENTQEDFNNISSAGKSKKRNKSVSFMLDETEAVVVKKSKSSETVINKTDSYNVDITKDKLKKQKKAKKRFGDKYGKISSNHTDEFKDVKSEGIVQEEQSTTDNQDVSIETVDKKEAIQKRKKLKKKKKHNSDENSKIQLESNDVEIKEDNQQKKRKKKKAFQKSVLSEDGADGEPALKSKKREAKPDAIVENLENLSIGENAHTLTNLLDEMSVAEKNKRKKNKRKMKKERQKNIQNQIPSTSSSNTELEKSVGKEKEKMKWKSRKWNKDKKGNADNYGVDTSVIVDNIPISMICTYKKLLANHFSKYGLIRKVGVAEVYPSQESKPVFTTTIQFYSEGAASELRVPARRPRAGHQAAHQGEEGSLHRVRGVRRARSCGARTSAVQGPHHRRQEGLRGQVRDTEQEGATDRRHWTRRRQRALRRVTCISRFKMNSNMESDRFYCLRYI